VTSKKDQQGWRPITLSDLKVGVVIRLDYIMRYGDYCMATIIAVHNRSTPSLPYITVARPHALVSENYVDPLLGVEVFDITFGALCNSESDKDYQVFQQFLKDAPLLSSPES
jgi:hypothetical protein